MTLQASGPITLDDINVELGLARTTPISITQSNARALAGIPSGPIYLSDFYGKSSVFKFAVTTTTSNANLYTLAVNAGWNKISGVQLTINAEVVLYATTTSNYGLTIPAGLFPVAPLIINYGIIAGAGGIGANGSSSGSGSNGSNGGIGLHATNLVSITNNGIIAGGGGGGGSGAFATGSGFFIGYTYGGGGGGGGQGYNLPSGGLGGSGNEGSGNPGLAGTGSTGGNGGNGAFGASLSGTGNANGIAGTNASGDGVAGDAGAGGGGGGFGAAGGNGSAGGGIGGSGGTGGLGGAAVLGNSFITWVVAGTRYGALT